MANEQGIFSSISSSNSNLFVADNSSSRPAKLGKLNDNGLGLHECVFYPNLRKNLLSFHELVKNGYVVNLSNWKDSFILSPDGRKFNLTKDGRLWMVHFKMLTKYIPNGNKHAESNAVNTRLQHERLCHF